MCEDRERLKTQIRDAFSFTPPPKSICDSFEGDEPELLVAEFSAIPDWRALDAPFVDRAPDGFGSALSFFSPEAFRYYLPAFLLADLDDVLERADPSYHLWHGLDDETSIETINPVRYGDQTWRTYATQRFASFSIVEVQAIAAYLALKAREDSFSQTQIEQALRHLRLSGRARIGHGEPVHRRIRAGR
jgi:Family of unknown function (DUF6714)